MLNETYIVSLIKPHIQKSGGISEVVFFELFSDLDQKEQYGVIDIMIRNKIELVNDEDMEVIEPHDTKDMVHPRAYQDYTRLMHLTNEQLCLMAQNQDDLAKTALIKKNERFIYKIALKLSRQYRQNTLSVDDLFQEGCIGCIKAIKRFDIARDFKFLTFSWHWIRQTISRALMDTGYTIRMPVHIFEKVVRVNQLRKLYPLADAKVLTEHYNQLSAKIVTEADISSWLRLSDQILNTTSLNTPVGEDQESVLQDFVIDHDAITVEEAVEAKLLSEDIHRVLSCLKEKERDILILRFGLNGGERFTLEEIGEGYGVTRERIRQIEAKALRKLRKDKHSKQLKAYYEGSI